MASAGCVRWASRMGRGAALTRRPPSVRETLLLGALLASFVAGVVVPIGANVKHARYPAYDLGLFVQTLLLLGEEVNPFNTVRGVYVFADHFDPVLFLVAPFARLGDPALTVTLLEAGIVVTGLGVLWWHVRRGQLRPRMGLTLSAVHLFSYATLDALHYPVHPTTWATLPILLLGFALLNRHSWLVLASTLLLLSCKEEFPFFCLAWGAWLWRSDRKHGVMLMLTSSSWMVLAFWLRPLLIEGEVIRHGQTLLERAWHSPWQMLTGRNAGTKLAWLFAPWACLWLWCGAFSSGRWRAMLGPLFALTPLLLIRLLSAKWHLHYVAPIGAGLTVATVFGCGTLELRKGAMLGVLAVTFGIGSWCYAEPTREAIARLVAPAGSPARQRLQSLERARTVLEGRARNTTLVAQNNLVARVMHEPHGVYDFSRRRDTYQHADYVLLERPPGGLVPATSHREVRQAITRLRRSAEHVVLLDDDFFFLAKRQATARSRSVRGLREGNGRRRGNPD